MTGGRYPITALIPTDSPPLRSACTSLIFVAHHPLRHGAWVHRVGTEMAPDREGLIIARIARSVEDRCEVCKQMTRSVEAALPGFETVRRGITMQGSFCRFYVHENARHKRRLLWEWLLDQANHLGIRGGSAFRAMAGFGRHHVLHEDHFFELAGSLTVEVEFIVTAEEAKQLLDLVRTEKIRLFYALIPAQFGILNPDATDPPTEADHD